MKKNNPFEAMRLHRVAILFLFFFSLTGVGIADDYVGGLPLTTVQSGTVSGDLYVDANNTWWPPNPGVQDIQRPFAAIPDVDDIAWARLYVSVYCGHMQNNYQGTAAVSFDGDGDGTYESALGTEDLNVPFVYIDNGGNDNSAFSGHGPGEPYKMVNDHTNRVTSDYLMWYDVTTLIHSQTPGAHVVTTANDGSFDGRIKVITLIVAYNDGDSDEVHYWVNEGHDADTYYSTEDYIGYTEFDLSGVPADFESAVLTVNHMASDDGSYFWFGDPIPTDPAGGNFQGAYFGYNSWNITSLLYPGEINDLAYDRTGQYYKIPLALLTVRETTSPSYNLTVTSVNPLTGTLFAREPNTVRITVRNNGPDTSPPAEVGLTSSDGFIGTAMVPSLAPNTQNMTQIVDTTVRPDAGATITYNATVGISSKTVSKVVTYNGYKGKRYWEGGSDVTTKRTFDLRGGFLVSPGDSHYVSGGVGGAAWNSYDVNWTGADLPVPEGATIREAWLYAPYTWDNSGQVPDHFHLAFNGQSLPYEDHYQDVSNFGAYYNYYYGLLTYNVTSLFNPSGNNATVGKDDADSKLAMYGLTLAVIYEKPGEPRRQIFMNEEFDILGADATGYATTPEEATAYVPFSGLTIVPGNVSAADLITFVPSGNMYEGDLLLNDDTIATNVWDYGESSGTQVAVDVRDVKAYLNAVGNIVGIRSTAGATPLMAASHEFLVVTYAETAPIADFTGSPTIGNAPLNVQFADSSTGTVTSWAWDFTNDGTVDSTLQNPDYTYASAGTYSVKLNVTGPGGSNAKLRTGYISVSDSPVAPIANFTGNPTSGNAPLNVQFTDNSTGTVTSYAWDFTNDGTVDSTLQNPNYTYPAAGTYSVKLNVTGSGGSDAKLRIDYITVSAPPLIAAFNATPINGLAPLSVTFTDQSSGIVTSRLWEYRSGSGSWTEFSSAVNPTWIFTEPGPYDIRLTVSNGTAENTATKTRYISVSGGPAPLVTVKNGTVSGDLYVGAFQPVAWGSQPASGVTSRDFDQVFSLPSFTDIQWARLYVNVYSGSGGGNWPLRTIVSFDGNGDGSYESILGVEEMDIQGASDGNAYLLNDHCNRVFSDYNTWYDVTGLISATDPAVHVKTEQMPPGTYDGRLKTVTLVVAYNDGDIDEVRYWVNAGHDYQGSSESGHQTTFSTDLLPSGWTSADLTNVHLASKDSTYTFNTVPYSGTNPVGPVNFFGMDSWDVTSSLHSGTASDFTYTHAASSSYKTILATLKANYQEFPEPVANFSGNPTTGNAPLDVQFTDGSTGTITSYAWDFTNDGTVDSTLQNPSYTYPAAGTYSVKLNVTGPGGSNAKLRTNYISVSVPPIAPVANFSGNPTTGNAPLDVQFTDSSTGTITSWAWDFTNDGTVDSTLQNPSYMYPAAGTYSVKLNVTGPGGSNAKLRTNYISVSVPPIAPVANFSGSPTTGNAPLNVQFTDSSTGTITSWAWDFTNDGTVDSTLQNPNYMYPVAGTYSVKLNVTGPGGSNAKLRTNYISVSVPPVAPVANFSGSPTTGNAPLNVQFTDSSTGTITSWAWDFTNDGTVDSTLQNPNYMYPAAGTYSVKLNVTGPGGSNAKLRTNYISVSVPPVAPVANFSGSPTTGNAPLNVQFTDSSTGTITSWAWDFTNDGTVDSTLQNPNYMYPAAGTYSVKLNVTGPGGSNAKLRTNYVTVSALPLQNATINGWVASGSNGGTMYVPGIRVLIARSAADLSDPTKRWEAVTDSRGMYTISGLPAGVTLYGAALSPASQPNGYFERPISYQVNTGRLYTVATDAISPQISPLTPGGTIQLNWILTARPPPLSVLSFGDAMRGTISNWLSFL